MERLDRPEQLHTEPHYGSRASHLLGGRRGYLRRLGLEGQRVPLVSALPARAGNRGGHSGSGERLLRLSLDAERRRVVELHGPARLRDRRPEEFPAPRGQAVHGGRQQLERVRRLADDGEPGLDVHAVPGSDLRHLDGVRAERLGVHLRGVLVRLRRALLAEASRQPEQLALPERLRAGHGQQLQREPVLAAVRRQGRCPLRHLQQLQQPRDVGEHSGQPQPDPALEVGGRREHLLEPRQGFGLLRPARLRDVPAGPRLRPRLRAGEERDRELDLPGDELRLR